jgi:hypothetical protein
MIAREHIHGVAKHAWSTAEQAAPSQTCRDQAAWQALYFCPLPQGQSSFRPIL